MPRGRRPGRLYFLPVRHGVAVRLADVQLHRHIQFQRQVQLPLKHFALRIARGKVVVVVQPDLAQHRALGKRQQPAQRLFPLVRPVAGVVGMDARGKTEVGVLPHNLQGAHVVGLQIAGVAHHHASGHARLAHALQHAVKVRLEAFAGEVGVGIVASHVLQRSPRGRVFPRGALFSRSPRRGRSPRPRR